MHAAMFALGYMVMYVHLQLRHVPSEILTKVRGHEFPSKTLSTTSHWKSHCTKVSGQSCLMCWSSYRPGVLNHSGRPGVLNHSGRPGVLNHSGRPGILNHSGRPGVLNHSGQLGVQWKPLN